MTLYALAFRNVLRNRFRNLLTVIGVAVAVLAFVLLRTVIFAWTVGVDFAAKDRIGTRHKVTFVMPLPKRYIDDVRQVPGVVAATWMNWFGAKDPRHDKEFFGTMAVDPQSFFQVYDELQVPPEAKEAFQTDRKAAIVGDVLAKKLGWKVGDKVVLSGTIYPGDWEFRIAALYTTTRKSLDRSSFFFNWNYLNDTVPERQRDQIGWIVSRVSDPGRTAEISQTVDRHFADRDVQTLSMSERAMNTSFLGMMSAVLKAVDIVSLVILLIMLLILGNTIAMGVRERTSEYGVLRAIGFLPRHLAIFVLGEALCIGALGGGLGLFISYPLVEKGMGRWIEENMGAFFPYFRIPPATAGLALLLALVLGLVAAALPAYRAARINVLNALRRVG
ncbi:MAG: ABC transporter permease [Polyangia bacterium]